MDENILNGLAMTLHDIWKEEKKEEGYHLPSLCPNYEKIEENEEANINDDLIHCNKCLSSLIDYDSLNDFQKKRYLDKAENFIKKLESNGLFLQNL
jgi:hypothetical protein